MTYSLLLSMLTIRPAADRFTFHTVAGALAASTRNTPVSTSWRGQILLGDAMLALAGLAKDHRHVGRRTPGLDPPGEPPGQPHQVGVVQLGVAVVVPAPPPHPEPARVMSERKERVEHDPIHAVIAAGQQIRIPQAELVAEHPTEPTKPPARVRRNRPKGHRYRAKSRPRHSQAWSG